LFEYSNETVTRQMRMSSDIDQVTCCVVAGPLAGESSQYSPPEGELTLALGALLSVTVRVAVAGGWGDVAVSAAVPQIPFTITRYRDPESAAATAGIV
jgi:hypothetical protein